MAYMRLGDLLIASGVITQEQLDKALAVQKETHQRLGDVLMQNGFITERNLIDALQIQLGVEFVDLTAVSIPVELARYVPRNIARKFCVVPVKLVQDTLYLAMSDPLDFVAQEQVKAASRKKVIPMIATRQATEQAIARLYGNEGTARVIEEMKREAGVTAFCAKPLFMSELRSVLAKPFGAEDASAAAEKGPDFSGKKLLVVEDNELNLEIASTILQEAGFEVDTAENGQIALEKVENAPADRYDLILMDIQMPVMDGYEATRRIRALSDKEKASVPIVAMTANAFEDDRKNALNAGMNGHIAKPLDLPKLFRVLSELMR